MVFFRAKDSIPHKTALTYLFPSYVLGQCDSLKADNSCNGLCNTQISARQNQTKPKNNKNSKRCSRKVFELAWRYNPVAWSQCGGRQLLEMNSPHKTLWFLLLSHGLNLKWFLVDIFQHKNLWRKKNIFNRKASENKMRMNSLELMYNEKIDTGKL